MIIYSLQLTLAPKKTQMGKLNKGFHFLGVQYDVAQTSAWPKKKEDTLESIKVSLHPRSIRRSIDKIRRKQETMALLNKRPTTAEHPASVHRQRCRWANWWARQHPQLSGEVEHVRAWIQMAGKIYWRDAVCATSTPRKAELHCSNFGPHHARSCRDDLCALHLSEPWMRNTQ